MFGFGKEYYYTAKVRGFEGKLAILEMSDKQVLRWPIKNLPDDIQAGMEIKLYVSTARVEQDVQEKMAKEVINSILSE